MTDQTQSLDPSAMLCAQVNEGQTCFVPGLGKFDAGMRYPVDESTCLPTKDLVARGVVELVFGVPHSPAEASIIAGGAVGYVLRKRDAIHKWGKEAIRKRAGELLREKPSSFFAEKSPAEIAADEIFAKEEAKVEKELKRRRAALAELRGELTKRAEKLRLEAIERNRQAALAEAEANKVLSANLEQAGELYALKTRLDTHVRELERAKFRDGTSVDWSKHSAVELGKVRDLVKKAVQALNAGDAASLRGTVDEIDKELAKRPEPPLAPNQTGRIEVGEGRQPHASKLGGLYG